MKVWGNGRSRGMARVLLAAVAVAGCRAAAGPGGASVSGAVPVSTSKPGTSPRLQAAQDDYLTAQQRVSMWEQELKAAQNRELRDARSSARERRLFVEQNLVIARSDLERARMMLKQAQSSERK